VSVDYGLIHAQTIVNSTCYARAVVPPGKDVVGIANPKYADANSDVSWTYPTPVVQTGTGEAIVSCTNNGLSGTAYAYFQTGSN
jgi:hypothetical protein